MAHAGTRELQAIGRDSSLPDVIYHFLETSKAVGNICYEYLMLRYIDSGRQCTSGLVLSQICGTRRLPRDAVHEVSIEANSQRLIRFRNESAERGYIGCQN